MSLWFMASLVKKRNDIADVAWGLGFVLLAWVSYFIYADSGIRGLFVGTLVSIWGLRLAWHIYTRNKGKAEDYRYLA
jgi:steroid 5-alpha reductase family enzyme